MQERFVIICDDRFNKNNILFLTDNKKNPKKRWSKFFRNAFVFNNYRAAARITAQYKYNNTRVAKLEK